MAFRELVKNFNRIREYMREFYVYGFMSREDYTRKSARSYDDERRRVQSWLGSYMQFHRTSEGKNVFLSIDSRSTRHNPLFKAFKAKSFTDLDITLHFLLFDLLEVDSGKTLKQLTEQIDAMLAENESNLIFDESTIRKKLKEYEAEGLICTQKIGRTMTYRRSPDSVLPDADVLDLASEILPCGVIGSFLLDKIEPHKELFTYKHHYITSALDSEILCTLFSAMHEKRYVALKTIHRKRNFSCSSNVVPLRILVSAQNGRQYLMAYNRQFHTITAIRTDNIQSVTMQDVCADFDQRRRQLDERMIHMWGVSLPSRSEKKLEHVEFTICHSDDEPFIPLRLQREKRCGTVERLDAHHCRFTADVVDSHELVPWIRTFLCRITSIHFSDPSLQKQFEDDLNTMYALYGLEDDHALQ